MTSFTFLLIHGAYHGAWCWTRVAERLRAAGHRVHALTHTGSGDRAHLLRPGLDLEVYVQDLLGLIEAEELKDVIAVAHSFGGMTLTGTADRRPERFRQLVYLDAVIPVKGEVALAKHMPPEVYAKMLKRAVEINGAPCFLPPPSEYFGVNGEADIAWVNRRLTPMAASLFESRLRLDHPVGNGLPVAYIRCTEPLFRMLDASHRYVQTAGWAVEELRAGHDAMVSSAGPLTELILSMTIRRTS